MPFSRNDLNLTRCVRTVVAVTTVALAAPGFGDQPESHRKFIELGWDIPSTAQLGENLRAMEATPFDGVMFKVEAKDDRGQPISTEAPWNSRPWKRAWFNEALNDLKSLRFTRFTDNFLRFNATPGNLDWVDDSGWSALSDKAGMCSWLAKTGTAKGLAIDFESYGARQFKFDATKGATFAATTRLARRRGAQLVQAIAREYPNAVLLTLWMNSINLNSGRRDNPDDSLVSADYGLLPAFVDGMLEAAPDTMVLVDGCESGYYMDSEEAYLRAANDLRSWSGPAMRLVSPLNRAKYRRQVQVGFGFYLDRFLKEAPDHPERALAHLERNLAFARESADEYVWIYGEQCRWWGDAPNFPKTVGRARLWEEAMPGIARAIAFAKDPLSAVQAEFDRKRAAGKLENLAQNGDFAEPANREPGALPAGFTTWQDDRSAPGAILWDPAVGKGSGRLSGVAWGCLLQSRPVQPGDTYAIQVDCLSRGSSNPALTVRWQTEDGKWTNEAEDQTFDFKPNADARGWQHAFGVVTVPPGARRFVELLSVKGQKSVSDVCWFDNLGLFRVP